MPNSVRLEIENSSSGPPPLSSPGNTPSPSSVPIPPPQQASSQKIQLNKVKALSSPQHKRILLALGVALTTAICALSCVFLTAIVFVSRYFASNKLKELQKDIEGARIDALYTAATEIKFKDAENKKNHLMIL